MKKKDKEKEFNVIVKFTRETGYYETESVDLELPTLKGTDETKEKIILKALSSLGLLNALSLEELVDKINLNEATISKLAKKSKSLEEFSLLVHKELVKANIHSLRRYYVGRDGEPGITVKEVLECGDWMDMYGCEFDIEESAEYHQVNHQLNARRHEELFIDLCNKKKETELGKEAKAIGKRMLIVFCKAKITDDPIKLDELATEYIELSKEFSRQKDLDFEFDRAYRFNSGWF